MRVKVNVKRAGRPAGAATRFQGITAFCREHGLTHQHVRMVLTGRRESARVCGMWRLWTSRRVAR
jgi:hypothetical protein